MNRSGTGAAPRSAERRSTGAERSACCAEPARWSPWPAVPSPRPVQASKLFQEVAGAGVITDWRRATASYARRRGLQFAAQDLAVTGPSFGRLRC